LKLFELTICTSKYFISVFRCKCVPDKNTDFDKWHYYVGLLV